MFQFLEVAFAECKKDTFIYVLLTVVLFNVNNNNPRILPLGPFDLLKFVD